MRLELYKAEYNATQAKILETLRARIANVAGVTLVGNRLTVRWNDEEGRLVDVHMAILSVDDGNGHEQEPAAVKRKTRKHSLEAKS